ncbi:MAG TPA: mitomycin resistance protein [Candidatus Omnitrophica bacterium]|nr:mitomycin resistance protein [Candidatus Omnitrophota bacterium]
MKKVSAGAEAIWFEEIPNVGKRIAGDFKKLGFFGPQELKGKSPFKLYQKLCKLTRFRHDPCVLDTFMAAVDFMNGAPAKPWWRYTSERKKNYPNI